MLTGVQVRNVLGALVTTFGMSELNTSTKYVITGITGQGPVKADIKSSPFGSSDGEAVQSANVPKRNMVFTLGYNPNYATNETVEDLRLALYKIMPPKASLTFRMLNDRMETVEIQGWVESLEPDIWTAEPSVVLSVICPLPNFKSLVTNVVQLTANVTQRISYPGSAYAGFTLKIDALSNINFIAAIQPGSSLAMTPSLPNGTSVTVNTLQGSRGVKRSDGANLLKDITSGNLFMGIGPMSDVFRLEAKNGSAERTANGTLTYKTEYVGV